VTVASPEQNDIHLSCLNKESHINCHTAITHTTDVRAAADLEDHIKPALPMLPYALKSSTNPGSVDQSDDTDLFSKQSYKEKNSEFSRFCKAIRTIEKERIKMRERLQVTNLLGF
jgi:hypothetical protein